MSTPNGPLSVEPFVCGDESDDGRCPEPSTQILALRRKTDGAETLSGRCDAHKGMVDGSWEVLGETPLRFDGYFILDGHEPVPEPHPVRYLLWKAASHAKCVVAKSVVAGVRVSTVFLGQEHPNKKLFETLVSGGALDDRIRRYSTWDEAAAGHLAVVAEVEKAEGAKAEPEAAKADPFEEGQYGAGGPGTHDYMSFKS